MFIRDVTNTVTLYADFLMLYSKTARLLSSVFCLVCWYNKTVINSHMIQNRTHLHDYIQSQLLVLLLSKLQKEHFSFCRYGSINKNKRLQYRGITVVVYIGKPPPLQMKMTEAEMFTDEFLSFIHVTFSRVSQFPSSLKRLTLKHLTSSNVAEGLFECPGSSKIYKVSVSPSRREFSRMPPVYPRRA